MAMLPMGVRVFVCTQPTDMRKSFDGLIGATKTVIGQSPLSGHLFVFVNRRATQTKILYWSRGGYCVWAKRLEAGQFAKVSAAAQSNAQLMTDTQLMMWLDGIEWNAGKQTKRFLLDDRVPN